MKDGPPLAFREGVGRGTFTKGLGYIPMRRYGGGCTLVLRADGATGEEDRADQRSGRCRETTNQCAAPDFAAGFAPGFAGDGAWEFAGAGAGFCCNSFTLTVSPSSSESAGFRTIQSDEVMPCKTSSVVP